MACCEYLSTLINLPVQLFTYLLFAINVLAKPLEWGFDSRDVAEPKSLFAEFLMLLSIALPQLIGQLVIAAPSIVDVIFLGHISRAAVVAYGKSVIWLRVFEVLIYSSCAGVSILCEKDKIRYAPDRIKQASSYYMRGVIVALLFSVGASIGTYHLKDVVALQGWPSDTLSKEAQRCTSSYGHLVWVAVLANTFSALIWELAFSTVLGGHSLPVLASAVACILSVVCNYFFIYTDTLVGIDPTWTGFNGSPLATSVTATVRFLSTVIFFFALINVRADDMGYQAGAYCSQLLNTTTLKDWQKWKDYLRVTFMKVAAVTLQSSMLLTALIIGGELLYVPGSEQSTSAEMVDIGTVVLLLTIYQIPLMCFNGVAVACANRISVALLKPPGSPSGRVLAVPLVLSLLCAVGFAAPCWLLKGPETGREGRCGDIV